MAAARALLPQPEAAAKDETDESATALQLDAATVAQLKARVIATAPEEPCAVWPCNTGTVALFEGMLTQWRTDGAGFCGLDYGVLPGVAQSRGIAPQRAWQLLPQLQIMEDEALQVFAERRERYIAESRQ